LPALMDSIPTARTWPIKADNARPETISYLRNQGFNISAAEKWPGCVEDRIQHLKGFYKIRVHPRCKHMTDEMRNYKWKVDPKSKDILPIPVDKSNHGIDGLGYSLDSHIIRRGSLGVWSNL
jgi:phage terminase large subunit